MDVKVDVYIPFQNAFCSVALDRAKRFVGSCLEAEKLIASGLTTVDIYKPWTNNFSSFDVASATLLINSAKIAQEQIARITKK